MNILFADTFYFLALLIPNDEAHALAERWAAEPNLKIVTTTWVLTEVADALCYPAMKGGYLALYDALTADPSVTIIETGQELWERGNALYRSRADKEWSLTDCISFVVMQEQGLREALTGDHHFEQAGWVALMK